MGVLEKLEIAALTTKFWGLAASTRRPNLLPKLGHLFVSIASVFVYVVRKRFDRFLQLAATLLFCNDAVYMAVLCGGQLRMLGLHLLAEGVTISVR